MHDVSRSGESTRSRIIDAAEWLFAARGIGAVPNSEITKAAEQKNNSAIAYHFGDRAGLIEAVLRRHAEPLDIRRQELLAELPPSPTLRQIVHVLVQPLAELLRNPGGRAYLRIQAQILGLDESAGQFPKYVTHPPSRPGIEGIGLLMLEVDPPIERNHGPARTQLVTSLLFHSLADRAAKMTEADTPDLEFITGVERAIESLLVISLD